MMKQPLRYSTLFAAFALFVGLMHLSAASAAEPQKPSPEAISQVAEYLANGSVPVVRETVTCTTIGDTQPDRFECVDPVDINDPINLYGGVYYWVSLFVPQKFNGHIEYRFTRNNEPAGSVKVNVSSSMRYRVWKYLPTKQAGEWKAEISSVQESGEEVIGSIGYTVQ